MPMPAAIASRGEWEASGRSLKWIVPSSGQTIPKRMFIRVVLPEPFSPSRPTIRPAGTSRSIERLARTEPYDFEIPRMRIIVAPCALTTSGAGSGAAARVVLGRLHLDLARRDLLLDSVQLRGDRRRHGRVQRTVGGIAKLGAAGGRVVAVRDVMAGELARDQLRDRGGVDVRPLFVDVGEHALGRDRRVSHRAPDGECAL